MTVANYVVHGQQFDFWCGGHTVYGAVVLIVNITLLRLFNNWTGWGELLIAMSILSFWFAMWFESHFKMFGVLYGLWGQFISSAAGWLGVLFMLAWVLTVEDMFKHAYRYFK